MRCRHCCTFEIPFARSNVCAGLFGVEIERMTPKGESVSPQVPVVH